MITAFVIPVLGDCPGEALGSHLVQAGQVARHSKHVQYYVPLNRMPHDVARNEVMQEALDNGADVLYFIDDDTLIPKDAFREMLTALRDHSAAVVSAHYYRRGFPYTCVWSKELDLGEGPSFYQVDASSGLHEIHTTGLGCALIDLAFVRAHLSRPWFEMLKSKRTGDTVIADDTTFLTKVRNAGGLILGHAGIRCVHLGGRLAVCDETVDWARSQFFRPDKGIIPSSDRLLIKEKANGNDWKQPSAQGGSGSARDFTQEARASAEPAIGS